MPLTDTQFVISYLCMTLDLDRARRRLDKKLRQQDQGAVGDDDWSYIMGRTWQKDRRLPLEDEYETETDLVDAALEVMYIRRDASSEAAVTPQRRLDLRARAARRAQSRGAPEWWPAECQRALENFRQDQRRTLADFGLLGRDGSASFVDLGDVYSLVSGVAAQEPVAGERLQLEVPTGYEEETLMLDSRGVTGWRGRWPDARMDFLRDRPSQREVPGEGRFARLHDRTKVLSRLTGCDEEDAIAFLFCDRAPWMPWIEVLYDDGCDATLIRVRHPEVSAAEVAEEYRAFRARSLVFGHHPRQRRRRLWPERVETFVDAYRAEHSPITWDKVYEAFCESYGAEAKKKYTTMRGFQRVYYLRKQGPPPLISPTPVKIPEK